MCYRPLHIKNNSRHYDPRTMPLYFECPCGKCDDCKRDRQSEWFVRSFYEWQHIKSLGGCGFFYTLTYNDDNLPHYNGIPCFSYEDIQLFIKRLRENLERKYNIHLHSYLVSSENGELYQRPHYHVNFYLDKQLMPWSFFNLVDNAWQKGFVYAGSDGGLIKSPSALLYVTKYITKDSSFASRDKELYACLKDDYSIAYKDWLQFSSDFETAPETFDELIKLRSAFINNKPIISWYNDFRRHYRNITTFKTSSLKFGYSAIDCAPIDFQHDKILVPIGKQYQYVPLPRYLIRHLYFDRVPNEIDGKKNKFVLNVRGKQHYLDTLDMRINDRANEYRDFFKSTRLTDYQFKSLDTHFVFNGNKDFCLFLDNLDIDYRRLAIYSLIYRNRFSLSTHYDYWNEYKDYVSDLFSVCEDKLNSPLCCYDTRDVNYINNNLFNFKPEFFIYEQLSLLYSQMVQIIRQERALFNAQKRETERKLRDIIKSSNLKIAV